MDDVRRREIGSIPRLEKQGRLSQDRVRHPHRNQDGGAVRLRATTAHITRGEILDVFRPKNRDFDRKKNHSFYHSGCARRPRPLVPPPFTFYDICWRSHFNINRRKKFFVIVVNGLFCGSFFFSKFYYPFCNRIFAEAAMSLVLLCWEVKLSNDNELKNSKLKSDFDRCLLKKGFLTGWGCWLVRVSYNLDWRSPWKGETSLHHPNFPSLSGVL